MFWEGWLDCETVQKETFLRRPFKLPEVKSRVDVPRPKEPSFQLSLFTVSSSITALNIFTVSSSITALNIFTMSSSIIALSLFTVSSSITALSLFTSSMVVTVTQQELNNCLRNWRYWPTVVFCCRRWHLVASLFTTIKDVQCSDGTGHSK